MDDQRIEQALHDAAPVVDGTSALDRVAAKRTRRRRVKRLEVAAVAAVVVFAVAGVTAVVTNRGRESTPHVAAPAARTGARIVDGGGPVSGDAGEVVAPQPVTLDTDEGYLRGPLFVGSTALSVAGYDRASDASYTFPPSRIVRIDGSTVLDRIDLKAEILSITEGEGARWAITRNPPTEDGSPPQTFLKRIAADGTVASTALPDGSVPNGPVAAVGGAVWVPLRDGVVQFDTSGERVRTIGLDPAETRSVAAIGKSAWVTDRAVGLRRLDVSNGATTDTCQPATPPLDWAAGDTLHGWLLVGTDTVALVDADLRTTDLVALPSGFTGETVAVADDRVWVTGTVDGAPAIVLLDGNRLRATVILPSAGPDIALVRSGADTVTAATRGGLERISLP